MTFDEIGEEMVLLSSSFRFNPFVVWILQKATDHVKYKVVDFEKGAKVDFGSLGKDDWDSYMGKALVLSSSLSEATRRLVFMKVLP
jgi:hypothetical protein